jgi:hypothetical protein
LNKAIQWVLPLDAFDLSSGDMLMTDSKKTPPTGGRVQIQVPANLEPVYANFALISNSASEIIIDLAQIMPRMARAKVKTRVVMTPMNAKLFQRALTEHISRYEVKFGEITIPEGTSLADQLFRPSSDPEGPENE